MLTVIRNAKKEDIHQYGTPVSQHLYKLDPDEEPILEINIGGENSIVRQDNHVYWHHDKGWHPNPEPYAALYCVKADKGSSPTLFCDMHAAWKDAPEHLKNIDELALNTIAKYLDRGDHPLQMKSKAHERLYRVKGKAHHPIVKEDYFYFCEAYTITDWEEELSKHCFQEKYIYTHYWEPGDLVIWDNLRMVHKRLKTDIGVQREHIRFALNDRC